MNAHELETEILKLDPNARSRLAARLLQSLEDLSPEEIARLWEEEAQRRLDDLIAGHAAERSAAEVFRDIRTRLDG